VKLTDDRNWYIAGGVRRGIGRSWLAWAHTLSEVDPGDTLYEAAANQAEARRWLRDVHNVPLRYEPFKSGRGDAYHAYCHIKHVEMPPHYDEETETWM